MIPDKEKDCEKFIKRFSDLKIAETRYSAEVVKIEIHDKKLLGEPVKALKVYCNLPKAVHPLSKKIHDTEGTPQKGRDGRCYPQ